MAEHCMRQNSSSHDDGKGEERHKYKDIRICGVGATTLTID